MIYLSKLAIALITLFILSGCASIFGSHTEPIWVYTPNCPQAFCTLENDDGEYYIWETPDLVTVGRAFGDLSITCEKNGEARTMLVQSEINLIWLIFYLLLIPFSLINWIIDSFTGASYDYPSFAIHPLKCDIP